ncbi:MAG TPA: hypothetical protein VGX28_15605 [Frankiaceae bacterium]|jgi:hypothetical protein|nr:hypothetical protein [Frankiaceae bacterium]
MRRYAGLVALLALTGCAQERAGSLPPPPPPPTSATAAPTATPPRAGSEVEVAARAYYAALERAGRDGDVAALRALVDPACECFQQVATMEGYRRAHRRLTTRYSVEGLSTHDVTATAGWATVTLTYGASELVGADGRVVSTYPGKTKVGRDLLFRKEGTTWRLVRLVLLG